ncbi:hypothetical protein P154DRAFT_610001 [Amniculicola lignicola CBS 123094]|uniref:Uncharacterized protein n=1 Tax=Amniculicola lignicola CBS 123094 TaxID=1392246 RepID=A0A6A5W9M4_9PLEO|nr:hypothetical protein P154DRAFT_610001 [Amniculicola lignicola CBS 123094]
MSSIGKTIYLTSTEFRAHDRNEAALKSIRFEQCAEALEYLQSPFYQNPEVVGDSESHVIDHLVKVYDDMEMVLHHYVDWMHETLGDIIDWNPSFASDPKLRDPRVKREIYYRGIQIRLGNLEVSLHQAIRDAVIFSLEAETWFTIKDAGYWLSPKEKEELEEGWKPWKDFSAADVVSLLGYFSVDEATIKKWVAGKKDLDSSRDAKVEREFLNDLAATMRTLFMSLKPFHHDNAILVDELGFAPADNIPLEKCPLCSETLHTKDIDTNAEHRPVQVICGQNGPHIYGKSCLEKWLAEEHARYLRDKNAAKNEFRRLLNRKDTDQDMKEIGKYDQKPPRYFQCSLCKDRPFVYRQLVTYPGVWECKYNDFQQAWKECDDDDEKVGSFISFVETLPPRPVIAISNTDVAARYKHIFGDVQEIRKSIGNPKDVDFDAIDNELVDLFALMMHLIVDRVRAVLLGDWKMVRDLYDSQVRVWACQQSLMLKKNVATQLLEFESGGAYGEE